jgi:hypothetical protein
MEETNVTDPATGRSIRVSVATRKIYRLAEEYRGIRNAKLNQIIAKDFAGDSGKVAHHFILTKRGERAIGEIRGDAGLYYISAIRGNYIDILTVQSKFTEPRYRVKDSTKISLED